MTPVPDSGSLGTETSWLLTEVRTVLNRARTALDRAGDDPQWLSKGQESIYEGTHTQMVKRRAPGTWQIEEVPIEVPTRVGWTDPIKVPHPDGLEIVAALKTCVSALEKWERTNRPRRIR
jgi:hypothetical protein